MEDDRGRGHVRGTVDILQAHEKGSGLRCRVAMVACMSEAYDQGRCEAMARTVRMRGRCSKWMRGKRACTSLREENDVARLGIDVIYHAAPHAPVRQVDRRPAVRLQLGRAAP